MPEIIHYSSSITHRRKGVALLMVLLIVMAIAIISMGFVARMDTELACGSNTLLRMQMDQLADSGLEHAKGLLLHPQEVSSTCWPNQQLVTPSSDYYDVTVVRDANEPNDYCTYNIACDAYRRKDTEKTGESRLWAQLRLDPCIALAVRANATLWNGVRVYGDVYAQNCLTNNGMIHGDVFAASFAGTGTRMGQPNPQVLSPDWPPVTGGYSNSQYSPILPFAPPAAGTYAPNSIWRHVGNLDISQTVRVSGMLLVDGNLTVRHGASASRIVAAKNLPALYVSGTLEIEDVNDLRIDGLVVVGGDVHIRSPASLTIVGGLFVGGALDPNGLGSTMTIIADPMKAAIVEGVTGSQTAWSPAAGGFFKGIRRWEP